MKQPLHSFVLLAVAVFLAATFALCTDGRGEPSQTDMEKSTHPLLVKARSVDVGYQPPEKADQKEAERLYLQFINENPDSPLVPYLYFHLGQTFSGWVPSEYKKYGHAKDYMKAGQHFEKAVEHHPTDKVSGLLMMARVCAATGDYGEAVQYLRRKVGLYPELPDGPAQSDVLIEQAVVWSQIGAYQLARADVNGPEVASAFRDAVRREMLWRRGDALSEIVALQPLNVGRAHGRHKVRVLAERLLGASPARIARNVENRREDLR